MDIPKVVTLQNISRIFALALLVCVSAYHSVAQDISIGDFRIPETRYQRLLGSLSGGWSNIDNNSSDALLGSISSSNSSPRKSSNLQTSFNYIFNHFDENNSLELSSQFNGSGYYTSFSNNQDSPSNYSHQSQTSTEYIASLTSSILFSSYIIPDQWHWYVSGTGRCSFDQERNNYNWSSSDSYSNDSTYYKNKQWNAALGAGIGFGKLRDGSAIFAVLRILDKLMEDNILTRGLTRDEILQLVDLYARKVEYTYSQDRYVKFFMKDVFAELQKMGVLKDNAATAYSALRAVEVLSEQIEPRVFGWRTQIGVQRVFNEQCYAYSSSGSAYYAPYSWSARDFLQFNADYGYPISINAHVNSSVSFNVPFIDAQRKTNVDVSVKGIYQIGERIDATVSYTFGHYQALENNMNQDCFTRTIRHNATLTFRFFIENNVNFSITGSYYNYQQDVYEPIYTSNTTQKGPSVSFGVNYRFI
jgi:hypothetical protein